MSSKPSYYITTPIYYVNDKPHIGHAYTTLACDVLARFKRLDGYAVEFLTGTDEHGQKVQQSARAAGAETLEFCTRVSQNFRDLADTLAATTTGFIRTTDQQHKKGVQAIWKRIEEAGFIYRDSYEGWYSVRDEAYFAEDELEEGPDGARLAPTGAPVEWVEEPSYFFKLSAFQDQLLEHYEAHPEFIAPESRRNEVASFVRSGLRDLSISRSLFDWGIPVPGHEDEIVYVWLDALTNYISYLGFPDTDSEKWRQFWPADVHMIGKDIIRFHCVYWPAFLMAADLPLPKRVYAHGWWTNEGQKISKSLGNVIDPNEIIEEFGLDQIRYFLMREVPFGQDGDFSRSALIQRVNSDLANGYGNLAQRSLSMIFKNCDGAIPEPGEFTDDDLQMLARSGETLEQMRAALDEQQIHQALFLHQQLISDGDAYIARQEPWVLRKSDPERMKTVLYVAADVVRSVAILSQPITPLAADRLLSQMNVGEGARGFEAMGEGGRLAPGHAIEKPQGVFPRFEEEKEE